MSRTRLNRWWHFSIFIVVLSASAAAIAGITAQGITAQGITAQGITAQGITAQGITAQGITAQGITAQGITAQGITAQGITAQGITAQGITAQGITAQGITAQGITAQGASLIGTDLIAADGRAVEITSVKMRGLTATSGLEAYTLTNLPTMSSGPGNYIAMSGGGAALHYAVAHTLAADGTAAEDLDLYIASEEKDPMPNLFHRFEEQANQDELYVVYYFHKWSGQWMSLCPYNPATKSASAMALPVEDATDPQRFVFACTATGVASKCARNWGYKPWGQATAWRFSGGTWALDTFDLKPYYDICTAAARAGYCQDDRSYTKNGTLVDLYDTRQIIWPNAIENPFSSSNDPGSLWMLAQEYFISQDPSPFNPAMKASALQRTRYKELSPIGECETMTAIDRLEHDHIADGRWANPLTSTPRLQVFSPTYCSHNEYEVGEAIPWDCSPCTTEVCKTMPGCCGAGGSTWTATCVGQATTVCQTGGVQWPPGKVWPRDIPDDDKSIYPTYLFGPQGAVLRADGTSGVGSTVTISGWACDPEWPGGSVSILVTDQNGVPLPGGPVRADQPLATPLAREVSAACDGPGRSYARHGFSFTLPENQTGNVYVYAIDQSTDNGPPAPNTLIRNGVVHVPRCAHSEHVAGDALSATCSTCASTVCNDGTHAACCESGWTDECAAAADACASGDSSALVNTRKFTSVTTGWIEAPDSGSYVFDASQQPSRLFINGTKVLDWFDTAPGTTSGSITLTAGQKCHLRWDRFQTEPPSAPVQGVRWVRPGLSALEDIRTDNLYAIAPGSGSGLSATYFMSPGFGGAAVSRTDANVDINKDIAPPGPAKLDLPSGYGPSFSAIWEGEIVPSFSEDYTFYVVGSGSASLFIDSAAVSFPPPPVSSAPGGCAHDLCSVGDKLDENCNTCVHDICQTDPFCCNGGYLSYYSIEPEWDARCVAAVEKTCPGSTCAPLPGPGSPQKKSTALALKAGVHYRIRLAYSNPSGDKTIRLLWSSARTARQAIPQYALYPRSPGAAGAGSGLNVTYFANGTVGDEPVPSLATVLATGAVADLSLTPVIGQLGVPLVNVLATPVDALSGKPSPPSVVRPRYGEEVFVDGGLTIHIAGIGGITDGWVRIIGGSGGDVIVPVAAGGAFNADVPTTVGTHIFKLVQQTFPGPGCVPPSLCAASDSVAWPLTVTLETNAPKAPEIISPTDPTHSAPAVPTAFNVVGKGTSGVVHVEDQGQIVPVSLPDINTVNADGSFTGQVTLEPGTPDNPGKGWHKLVFNQGGPPSRPVFMSVGIDPPTVVFPRTDAEIDCEQPDQTGEQLAFGTLPYTQEQFGRLRVMEETGRQALGFVGAETSVSQPQPGQPNVFLTRFNPGPGRHVVYFFQAPDPPAQATQDEIDAHFRAYSRLADTPTSRIVIDRKPPRFPIPRGLAGVLGGRGFTPGTTTNLPPQLPSQGPFPINVTNCGPNANPRSELCAQPNADVNARVNGRLYTTRADADGAWSLSLPLPKGWSKVTFAQVTDSRVGGAWSESCLSNEISIGVRELGAPVVTVPADLEVEATSPQGAKVFYPDVTAVRATDGAQVPVECDPPRGAMFGLGRNAVLCTATDPTTGAVGVGEFAITVVDTSAPVINVPSGGVTAEATSKDGALVTYDVTATDAVDGPVPVNCAPSSPALFPLDQIDTVKCVASDHLGHTAEATFPVRVVDTTPPTLCPLKDIKVGTNSGAGAIVNFKTCASDIVDGPVEPVCNPPSGSLFPLGKTLVKCAAIDRHGNKSPVESFTVEVGDTTPPVLKLPGTVSAIATSKSGARVNYTVTATDNVDPAPKVKCDPPSGALFPLGTTTVTCKATDVAGNSSTGKFTVKVTVAWTGLLAPINADGSARFPLGLPIALRFALTGASAKICDLDAKLFVAPLDAAGKPGAERSAVGLPPGAGNLFYFLPIINQYAMLLDSRPMTVGGWQLRVDLGDGEIRTQRISFFKL